MDLARGSHRTAAVSRFISSILLLKATNRLAEAEPLMQRHLVIFLKFTRTTGHAHPYLRAAFGNYLGRLSELSLGKLEIDKRTAGHGPEAGYDAASFATLLGQLQ